VLCGSEGTDRLRGGAGADRLYGGIDAKVAEDTEYYVYDGDLLEGGPGDDVLDPGTDARHDGSVDTISYLHAAEAVTVDLGAGTATGEGTDTVLGPVGTLVGSAYDDVLTGSDRSETIVGGAGRDRLVGLGGNDRLAGGAWAAGREDRVGNVLLGGPGRDELHGSSGDDVVRGGTGNDLVQGGAGRDRAWGGAGDDSFGDLVEPDEGQLIRGGPGHDSLAGLGFSDGRGKEPRHARGRIDLREGTTRAWFTGLSVTVQTAGIEDVVTPLGDLWTVWGTRGPNELVAGFDHSPVRLYAGAGDDRLFGSFEDDVLDGGPGHDTGTGWTGHDRIRSVERRVG
jgi:Ca2+-binding RTX toxin-like protein